MTGEEDCIFCRIARGDLPSREAYADESVYAFHDIDPKAPVHILIIPRKHISTLNDLGGEDEHLTGHIIKVASGIAKDEGLADRGYRLVANCLREAGQTVFHIHFHLLGGRRMGWPPG